MPKPWVLFDAQMSAAGAARNSELGRRLGVARRIALAGEDVLEQVGKSLDAGDRTLVIGGDCGVALAASAVRGRGRFALAYIDAQSDFAHPENLEPQPATTRGEAAALVGRGGAEAIFLDEDTALIGFRKDDPAFYELNKTNILIWPMFWLYEHSRQELDKSLLRRFDRPEIDGIWIHLDADALDPTVITAVPHPLADGLAPPELVGVLRTLIGTGKVEGMSIANVMPEQDTDGRQAVIIADVLAEAFA